MSLTLECQSCGAALIVEASALTAKCPYCASPSIALRPPTPDRPAPELVLGFVLPEARALALARDFVKRPLFAPQAFRRAVPGDIRGLYLPAYLYSAAAYSDYTAQIGEDYTVTETYTTTDSKGNTVTETRTRVETEWRSLRGQHATYVHDLVVTASRGIPNAELEAIEPFDLRALHRFTPKVISGWLAEEPTLKLAECAQLARQEAVDAVSQMLGPFMPGDHHRDLSFSVRLEQEHLALALLPVWVLAVRYREDKPLVRLLVNGQTGKVHGKPPVSALKITALVLLVLGLIGGLIALAYFSGALR